MKFTIIAVLCTVFMLSCTTDTENYEVGNDFVDNEIDIKVIDTFTVNTGTYKLDSIITSGSSRLLLGNIKDQYLGRLTAQAYMQLQNYVFNISSDAVYDSIGFVLNYDSYYYGDTLQPQTYKIHRVIETFEPADDVDEFYNTSTLGYDDEVIGQKTFIPEPTTDSDSIYIPMNYELGEEIFNKIVDKDIDNSYDFLQYFRGITIVPDKLIDSHVLGFNSTAGSYGTSTNSGMRLYYTTQSEDSEGVSNYIEFVVSSAVKQFNAITSDVTGTEIDGVNDVETVVSSDDTNHLFYAQAGTGVSARIEISSIKRLKELSDIGTPLGSELTFRPLKGTYDDNNSLKDSLSVYVVDHKNRIMNLLTDSNGYTAYAILNENDDEFDSNTYYSIDLNGFVEEILSMEEDLNYALMVQFTGLNNTVNRVILEDPEKESERVKLTVKFLNY